MWSCGRRSTFSNVDDSLGKGLRRFLGQIVSDAALDDPVRVFAGEFPGIGTTLKSKTSIIQRDKRNGPCRNVRVLREQLGNVRAK